MGKKNNKRIPHLMAVPATINDDTGKDRVLGQKRVAVKKEGGGETEKKNEGGETDSLDEVGLIVIELCTIKKDLVDCLRRNLQYCFKGLKDHKNMGCDPAKIEIVRAETESLLRATNQFEQNAQYGSPEEFEEDARTVLSRMEETLEFFGWTKEQVREFVTKAITTRIDVVRLRFELYMKRAQLERLMKKEEEDRLRKEEEDRLKKEEEDRLKKEAAKKEMENGQKKDMEINEFSYREFPQDRLTCKCHGRMAQIFESLGSR